MGDKGRASLATQLVKKYLVQQTKSLEPVSACEHVANGAISPGRASCHGGFVRRAEHLSATGFFCHGL